MRIFLSYGHDSNAPLIEKIKEYLSKDAEGNRNNLGLQYYSTGNTADAKELLKKAINSCLMIEDKTEDDTAALATYYVNLGIILDKEGDLEHAYESYKECANYRKQLSKNNPNAFLQPLGMILLRMAGLSCCKGNEYDAKLNLMKARYVFEKTDLQREQYESALQQMADSISKMKRSYKLFFGLFIINEDKLKEEFVKYFI